MDAIEIYKKVLDVTEGEDYTEVNIALNFVRQKLESAMYAKNNLAGQIGYAGNALSGAAQCDTGYAQKAHAAAVEQVREIVRQEMNKGTSDTAEAKAA